MAKQQGTATLRENVPDPERKNPEPATIVKVRCLRGWKVFLSNGSIGSLILKESLLHVWGSDHIT
ncbi:hypothetical protein PilKf_01431 [Pillotina sp. SPG140]|jgi:hypothetical protein